MVQTYKDQRDYERRLVIAIGDKGIGIKQSLSANRSLMQRYQQHLKFGSDYIRLALQVGITSLEHKRGIGLSQVRQIVQGWNGSLTIRSGSSRVTISPNQIPDANDFEPVPGTQIVITAVELLR